GDLLLMDLYAAQEVFARPGFVSGIDVVVEHGAEVSRVQEAIAGILPDGVRVASPAERQADLRKVTQSLPAILDAMGILCLVAAFLITFNRLSTVFDARAWQLGVLRAVGVRRRRVWLELLQESLLVGAAGVALGIPLGLGLGRVLLPVIAATTELSYKLVAPESAFVAEPGSLLRAAALGLGASLLAAVLPAWRASRREPVATI